MGCLQHVQALDHIQCLKRERNGKACESFFSAALQSMLSPSFREHSSVFGKQRMAKEWMPSFRCCLPPKSWRPAEQDGAVDLPVLKQVDQRIPIIVTKQSWIE